MVRDEGCAVVLVAQHLESVSLGATEEDVVDNAVGVVLITLLPAVECSAAVGLGSLLACVEHLSIQGLEDGVCGQGVEVSRKECGHTYGYNLSKALADECQTLALCHLTYVVEVSVDVC